MVKETCEVCGYVSNAGAVARHHLNPKSVTEQAGVPDSAMVNLCGNCHAELHNWYKMKVAETVYDPKTKRFRAKSWGEMVRDYDSAYRNFKRYKEEQKGLKFKDEDVKF